MKKTLTITATAVTLLLPIQAQSILTLNFGDSTDPTFNESNDLVMEYSGVATGINATLVSSNAFLDRNSANHGSVAGDIRVNMRGVVDLANISTFTLNLWDATAGNGFDTAYNPGNSYEWTLGFYDIDSGDPTGANYTWDVIRVRTSGSYEIATTSDIDVVTSSEFVSFSGENVGVIPGQDGLGASLTQEQAEAAVLYTFTDQNSIVFDYAADRNSGTGGMNGRNALVNGGSIVPLFNNSGVTTTTTTFTSVPEPSSLGLLIPGFAMLLSRRKRKNNAR